MIEAILAHFIRNALHQRVLENDVFHAGLTELLTQSSHLLDVDSAVIDDDDALRLFKALFDLGNLLLFELTTLRQNKFPPSFQDRA